MYREKKIALVIPAYNEEKLIKPTLKAVPDFVDRIFVVDDASIDNTAGVVGELSKHDHRIELISHEMNSGPGQGIITGYKRSAAEGCDIAVVAGGDNQMPLNQMERFLDPLIDGEADYTKGNRFVFLPDTLEKMPKSRLLGNVVITGLTKISSGYYKVMDVVDGYTATTKKVIDLIDWDKAWKGYGYPMDFLIRLNAFSLKVKDVPRSSIYLKGERQSQIKGLRYALKVSPMLLRGFFWRLITKYIYRDFHPLVFFYFAGLILFPFGIFYGLYLVYQQVAGIGVSGPRAILCALSLIMGLQFLLFAMLFDMQESK